MQKIMTIFLTLFSLISCEYQEDPLDFRKEIKATRAIRNTDIILDAPTNSLGMTGNFQLFLDQFLVEKKAESTDTLVDYDKYRNQRGFKEGLELRQNLHTIIAQTDLSQLSQDGKVAFLINAYNFFAIEMISDNYFTNSGERLQRIIDIKPNAFKQKKFNVGGFAYSLDQIEKEILMPLVTFTNGGIDARVHFAVICAANGCPILMKKAYQADQLQAQLTAATVAGLKLKRNLDEQAGTVTKLFNWYSFDFNNHSELGLNKVNSYKEFISLYAPTVDTSNLDQFRNNAYDWDLNKVINESDIPGLYKDMQFFLDRYVQYIKGSKDTLINYEKLFQEKNNTDILSVRNRIYTSLEKVNLQQLSKNEKVAFLTNAYNFLAIEVVIKNYKDSSGNTLNSISDIGGRGSFSAFKSKEFNIGGTLMSLDDIEKGMLVPTLTFENGSIDARLHFAVICAANGCPILKKQAYLPSLIDYQYTSATVESLKERRNFNLENGVVNLTNLFNWYASDFSNHSVDGETVISNTAEFLEFFVEGLSLESIGSPNYIDYDWSLNKL